MKWRKLETKDASRMLEWMHDDNVVRHLDTDFSCKTLEDCLRFIRESWNSRTDFHRAVVDDKDAYMGTVSLKHIDEIAGEAEFAIVVCRNAMGKGFSQFAMKKIIQIGFDELGLQKIYWYVRKENVRAVKFYEKEGFRRTEPQKKLRGGTELIWYSVQKKDIYP